MGSRAPRLSALAHGIERRDDPQLARGAARPTASPRRRAARGRRGHRWLSVAPKTASAPAARPRGERARRPSARAGAAGSTCMTAPPWRGRAADDERERHRRRRGGAGRSCPSPRWARRAASLRPRRPPREGGGEFQMPHDSNSWAFGGWTHTIQREVVRQLRRAAAPAQPRRREVVERRRARIAGERVVLGVARREVVGARALEQLLQPRIVGRQRIQIIRRRRRASSVGAPARRAAARIDHVAPRRRVSAPRARPVRAGARGRAPCTPAAVPPTARRTGRAPRRAARPSRGAGPLGGEAEVPAAPPADGPRQPGARATTLPQFAQIVAEQSAAAEEWPTRRAATASASRSAPVARFAASRGSSQTSCAWRSTRLAQWTSATWFAAAVALKPSPRARKRARRARGLGEHAVDERLGLLRQRRCCRHASSGEGRARRGGRAGSAGAAASSLQRPRSNLCGWLWLDCGVPRLLRLVGIDGRHRAIGRHYCDRRQLPMTSRTALLERGETARRRRQLTMFLSCVPVVHRLNWRCAARCWRDSALRRRQRAQNQDARRQDAARHQPGWPTCAASATTTTWARS